MSNFGHFVHSELFMFLVQVKLAWSSLFSPLQQVPRPRPSIYDCLFHKSMVCIQVV